MTIKTAAVAFASVVLLAASTRAGDLMDDLATMNLDSINETAADVEEFDLASIDMDNLEAEAGDGGEESDAIEACFRRFGGYRGGRGWGTWGGHRNYGYRSFGRCYSNYHSYCQPAFHCYRPVVRHCYQSCYTPIVRHCYPVVTSYWGCH